MDIFFISSLILVYIDLCHRDNYRINHFSINTQIANSQKHLNISFPIISSILPIYNNSLNKIKQINIQKNTVYFLGIISIQ